MGFVAGDHVRADFGDGLVIAHVAGPAHENAAGETKWPIQAPDGSVHDLTHREPGDVDAAGTGRTFRGL